ncbi:MAG: YidC/Oxa1 family membrane protein insertase [Candidatus Paceibacterota bacterium]|jgi:YidC/Oxa1 family membrane protein insertase
MSAFFHSYLYEPILAILLFIYNNLAFHDLGIAIIFLTVLVRVVLFPVFYKSAKDQALMQHLQPHIKKIQLDHKDDKERQAKELLELYKQYKLNPFSGFLLLLIQLPIFIVLFQVFSKELSTGVFITTSFLGLIALEATNYFLPVFAAAAQYFQGKLSLPTTPTKNQENNPLASMGKTMVIMGPIFTFFILLSLPSALSVYWVVSTAFSIVQQLYINKRLPKFENE